MHDLLSISDLDAASLTSLLEDAQGYADALSGGDYDQNRLAGKIILSLFFEDSTRTRTSFEMAAKRLGAEFVTWDAKTSSLSKNESLLDTLQTLNAMKPDGVIVRHSEYNAPHFVAQKMDCPVINAGDSYRAHPTQALLDALTMRQTFGSLDGLTVAICGDVAHSRVANSNIVLLRKLGVNVRVIAPPTLLPQTFPAEGVETYDIFEDGLPGCDVVMMLRIQKERMDKADVPEGHDYFRQYGLTYDKLKLTGKTSYVMHPGPMNRGIEIADDLADDPELSLVTKQVANGIPVRMAVLAKLLT